MMKRLSVQALVLINILLLSQNTYSQPECRSILGAHMKPAGNDSVFSWAGELTTVPVYMTNRFADNTMLFLGTDITDKSNRHSLYLEGGLKVSVVDAIDDSDTINTVHKSGKGSGAGKFLFGAREVFYRFRGDNTQFRAGLSTTRTDDYFMVNERMVGLNYTHKINALTINALGGNVSGFARMTDFCGTKRLTNLVDKSKYETVGENFGETNLAAVTFNLDLKTLLSKKIGTSGDEFAMTDEFAPMESKPAFSLNNIGLLYVQEYSTIADTQKFFVGSFLQADLPFSSSFKAEGVYQSIKGSNAVIYYGLLEKDIFWHNAQNTTLQLGYFGTYEIDKNARFGASFSNLFKGEIMRLDAIDVPIAFAGVKHNFGGQNRFYIQLQGIKQIHYEKINEVDLEFGIDLFKRLRVVSFLSYINSEAANKENLVGKLELRLGF
jgi:hypothetical protein